MANAALLATPGDSMPETGIEGAQNEAVADEADDAFTADFLTGRLGQHEKNVWMLEAVTS